MNPMISFRNCTLQQSSVNRRDQCVHRECHCKICRQVAPRTTRYDCTLTIFLACQWTGKELADMAASFVLGKVFQENCCAAALFHTCGRTLTTARASEWITDTNLSSSIRNKGNNDYGLVDLPRMCKARRLADSRKINQTIVNATCVPAERLVSVILSDGLAVVSAGQQVLGRAATEQLV